VVVVIGILEYTHAVCIVIQIDIMVVRHLPNT